MKVSPLIKHTIATIVTNQILECQEQQTYHINSCVSVYRMCHMICPLANVLSLESVGTSC